MRLLSAVMISVALAAGSLTVTRASQGCEFHVAPVRVELNTAAGGGSVVVDTQPGCAWTVDASDGWLHPTTAGGSGSGVIGFSADAVPVATEPPRQARLRVRWNTPTAGQDVLVTQSTGSCDAAMTRAPGPTSAETIGGKGGFGNFWVLGGLMSSPWRVVGAPDWITFVSPPLYVVATTFVGDGTAFFDVAPNPYPFPRDGVITFCSGQTMTVHQSGRSTRGTALPVPADFDDDGRSDPAVFRPSTGTWWVLLSQTGYSSAIAGQWGTDGTFPLPGDYDGDNRADLAIYNPLGLFGTALAGNWNIRYSSNVYAPATKTSYPFPTGSQYTPQNVPLLADFNGDGKPDFVTFKEARGAWAVQLTNPLIRSRLPQQFPSEIDGGWQWGLPGDVPVPADYDGDRLAELAVWRPSNGLWFLRMSSEDYSTATFRVYQWGLPGDRPIVGDFDGDGRADLAVWRPSDGAWYIVYSSLGYNPAAATVIQWGLPGDVPVAGDYDGDGRTDLAVWRPSNGTWFILQSSRGYSYASPIILQWGLPGDIPLSGRITGAQ